MSDFVFFREMDISLRKVVKRSKYSQPSTYWVMVVDGEDLGYYLADSFSPDGFYSDVTIRLNGDKFSDEIRRSTSAIPFLQRHLLKYVKEKGHYTQGNFDTKNYIKEV